MQKDEKMAKMAKIKAAELFGGKFGQLAEALEVSRDTITRMSDPLPNNVADQVIGAGIRLKGEAMTKAHFPDHF